MALAALAAAAAAAGEPKAVAILAPRDGAVLPGGSALVIGRLPAGAGRVEVEVNGRPVRFVTVRGGAFYATVPLLAGRNAVRVTAGGQAAGVALSGGAGGGYRYHPEAERCGGCHGDGGFAVAGPTDAVCYRCHDRKDGGRNVHGPLGGGDCTSCHDPHGSANPGLTVEAPGVLCRGCHDQKSSEAHLRAARGKPCTACHDPHSADRPFLGREGARTR